jgi:hypothetical protein
MYQLISVISPIHKKNLDLELKKQNHTFLICILSKYI